ncbi:STAS domain-containing protein [bacterium]|nr:STAS domain-containing protein [bacterium]
MLEARVECIRETARIVYNGDTVDIGDGPLVEVEDLLKRGVTKLLVNLEGMYYLNSAGISTFLATHKLANEKKAKLALYNLHPNVEKVIRMTRMETLLPCFDNECEAARYLDAIPGDSSITTRDTIIVIEDTIDISTSLKNVFEEFKQLLMYKIIKMKDLDGAFNEIMDLKETGLIILDVNHTPTSVMRFLEKVKTTDCLKHIPILIATPDELISNAHFLIRNGADDMLRYPFNKYEVASRIRFVLYHQRKVEEKEQEKEKAMIAMASR